MSNTQASPMWQMIEYLDGLMHPSSSTNIPVRTAVQQGVYRKIKQKAIELLELEQSLPTPPQEGDAKAIAEAAYHEGYNRMAYEKREEAWDGDVPLACEQYLQSLK